MRAILQSNPAIHSSRLQSRSRCSTRDSGIERRVASRDASECFEVIRGTHEKSWVGMKDPMYETPGR